MDTKSMDDNEGKFGDWVYCEKCRKCPKCSNKNLVHRIWDPHCGGYTDWQYKCIECEHVWWIDGPDS
ncbi:hypothetical protein LCGC14_1217610 [marine sediment metagenome]|uniref:Uncharacterized protein n=1 Tax=marine sediment metagenome TaxID=412755 RepID=A0A0F9PGT7_9ZZZZ